MAVVEHTFEPVFDKNSKILIVGTIPSEMSRKNGFYYGNPNNRFYGVLSTLLKCAKPNSNIDKKQFLLSNGIAVYDVLKLCEIKGSADSTISDASPNDFSPIFENANIKKVFANGRAAYKYYNYYIGDCEYLPSTSPANASWTMERLIEAWSVILQYLNS